MPSLKITPILGYKDRLPLPSAVKRGGEEEPSLFPRGLGAALVLTPRGCLRLGVFFVLALALGILCNAHSVAQLPLPEAISQGGGSPSSSAVVRYGSIEVAPVNSPLDGKELFKLASPTVYDRSPDSLEEGLAVERRAEEVNVRLWRAIDRPMDPETLQIEISRLNNVTIINARDNTYTQPLILVSVTGVDADFNGKPIDELAIKWQGVLEQELRDGLKQFSQEELIKSLVRALQIVLMLGVMTAVLGGLKYGVGRRQRFLRRRKQALKASEAAQAPVDPQQNTPPESQTNNLLHHQRTRFLEGLQQTLNLDQRLWLLGIGQWLLFWLGVLAWYLGLYWLLSEIPFLARFSRWVLGVPISLLAVWFFTSLAIRISHRLVDGLKTTWQEYEFINLGDAQRRELRASSIAGASKGMITVLIVGAGLLVGLNILGFSTSSVLAIGGLLGLAISFGSQSLIKDLVNGCLILAEDQFAIGDVIDLGHVSGLVENLNLRITQLRSVDGELVTVPNSMITEVKNLTRSWSRVNYSVDVAYQTNPEKALMVLRQVAQELYEHPDWRDKMLAPPDVLGIDRVSHQGMTITTWIQTAPAQQWAVGREFRFRVRKALEENGIEIGIPQQTFKLNSKGGDLKGQEPSDDMPPAPKAVS